MHFYVTKNNMATLNNERLAHIWRLGNVKLQTRNCELKFAVSDEEPVFNFGRNLLDDLSVITQLRVALGPVYMEAEDPR